MRRAVAELGYLGLTAMCALGNFLAMPRQHLDAATRKSRLEMGERLGAIRRALNGGSANRKFFGPFVSALNIPTRTWYGYEHGHAPPPEIILRLILEFRVSPRWLLNGEGEMFPAEHVHDRSSADYWSFD
jgi:hypothetical protein